MRLIKRLLSAGLWGPSVHGVQPIVMVGIKNKNLIKRISCFCIKKSRKSNIGVNALLSSSGKIVEGADWLLIIGINMIFFKQVKRIRPEYLQMVRDAELSAAAASIQNILLVAEEEGIGSCWLSMPLLCEREIQKMVRTKMKMVAVIALGYPAEKCRRSPRILKLSDIELLR